MFHKKQNSPWHGSTLARTIEIRRTKVLHKFHRLDALRQSPKIANELIE